MQNTLKGMYETEWLPSFRNAADLVQRRCPVLQPYYRECLWTRVALFLFFFYIAYTI